MFLLVYAAACFRSVNSRHLVYTYTWQLRIISRFCANSLLAVRTPVRIQRENQYMYTWRNNVDDCKGYGTRTMKSLWIAWASSSRDVGPVIFNNKAMEVKWSDLSKVFTIRPAHIQPQWVMVSAARAPVALIALARLFFTACAGLLCVCLPREIAPNRRIFSDFFFLSWN